MKTWLRPLLILVLIVLAIVAPIGQGNYIIYVMASWLILSIAAMGLDLTLGYAGQISLAQASFMAIGAYITALLSLAGWHWITAMPLGLLACFVVGLVLGYPALRVKGHFLAFVTLAFNTLVFLVLRNEEWLTGGTYGLVGIPRPNFGLFSTMRSLPFYYFTLAVTVIAALAMWGVVRSPWGRAFKALRENPIRAESLGVDTRRITLLAFAIGSMYGGLAGSLIAPLVQFIEPGSFSLAHSLRILLMVIVGSAGYFFGPFLGAAVVILLPEFLRFTGGYYLIIYAVLVIVMLVFVPSGLIGIWARIREQFIARPIARADLQQGAHLK
ncbi:branched-chain amino acid ABC transporter permease [Microvirga massiliensis]|uniref:branched-chain amino acid ABC transporter permease n=1 Tax=Microvirga massiliensis TaxID=1033741 RepID=UPI00062B408E|nr:branched-chain amino acid ABC transporter permease [Microvirga massiliensis]